MSKIRTLGKRGNSISVNIHPFFLEVAGFKIGDNVMLNAEKGIITITKQEDEDNEWSKNKCINSGA